MYKVLIVEDDEVIAASLQKYLEEWGYQASTVTDFKLVKEIFVQTAPQLVLLDIRLPFFNGFYWCEEIRKISKVPILFLSSTGDNMSIVMAVNSGADDFVSKPFDIHVLLAKIQALLRRTYDFAGSANVLEHGGVFLNMSEVTVTYEQQKAELTKNEFKILQTLMENPGHTVSREVIMQRLWESDSFVDDNTLTVNIARLRKKLESLGIHNFVETKKNMGYIIH